jgi:hypothetical protein
VIFNVVKFCETELFDVPPLVAALKARGVASYVPLVNRATSRWVQLERERAI